MQTYKYDSFVDCVRQTYKTERYRGFFRGVTAPLASVTVVRTISFSVYQRSKYAYSDWFRRNFGVDPLLHINTPGTYPTLSTIACFGAAGATAGYVDFSKRILDWSMGGIVTYLKVPGRQTRARLVYSVCTRTPGDVVHFRAASTKYSAIC